MNSAAISVSGRQGVIFYLDDDFESVDRSLATQAKVIYEDGRRAFISMEDTDVAKGDLPGHPFRGNQWAEGEGVSRDDLPEHVRAVVPPSYTVVKFNANPNATCIAIVEDAKGREKRLYSDEHHATKAAGKFARIDEMRTKFDGIMRQNGRLMESSDDRVRQNAECFHVVATTGLRPGSERDTKADRQAYGATTLRREHVVVDGDEVRLRFVGKNGKDLDIPVHDPKAAEILRTRAAAASEGGRIFPAVSDRSLLDHTHTMDGGGFKTKDLRTHLGTHIAAEEVRRMPEPKTESERKKAIRQVGDAVASRLGNTRTVALQAYISPSVFSKWGKIRKDFQPDQPRDEAGRWVDGGGGEGQQATAPAPSLEEVLGEERKRIGEIASRIAADLKSGRTADSYGDVSGVYIKLGAEKGFVLNGQHMMSAASYSPGTSDVTVRTTTASQKDLEYILAHEIQHGKFDRVNRGVLETRDNPDRLAARSALGMDMTDPESKAKRAAFAKDDGVTPYSKAYWAKYKAQPTGENYKTAVNETLAEMSNRRHVTGKLPGSDRWREVHAAYERAHHEITQRRKQLQ